MMTLSMRFTRLVLDHGHDRYENGTKKMGRVCLTLII